MGEAKRRKQLDPNYGRVYSLSNKALKLQEAERILTELFESFSKELKQLMIAVDFPDNYSQTTESIKDCFELRVSKYTHDDRCFIARFIFGLMCHLEETLVADDYNREYPVSPIIICCFLEVTKQYLEPDALSSLKNNFQREYGQLSATEKSHSLSRAFMNKIEEIIP